MVKIQFWNFKCTINIGMHAQAPRFLFTKICSIVFGKDYGDPVHSQLSHTSI